MGYSNKLTPYSLMDRIPPNRPHSAPPFSPKPPEGHFGPHTVTNPPSDPHTPKASDLSSSLPAPSRIDSAPPFIQTPPVHNFQTIQQEIQSLQRDITDRFSDTPSLSPILDALNAIATTIDNLSHTPHITETHIETLNAQLTTLAKATQTHINSTLTQTSSSFLSRLYDRLAALINSIRSLFSRQITSDKPLPNTTTPQLPPIDLQTRVLTWNQTRTNFQNLLTQVRQQSQPLTTDQDRQTLLEFAGQALSQQLFGSCITRDEYNNPHLNRSAIRPEAKSFIEALIADAARPRTGKDENFSAFFEQQIIQFINEQAPLLWGVANNQALTESLLESAGIPKNNEGGLFDPNIGAIQAGLFQALHDAIIRQVTPS